jgi:hypothetical protein
VHFSVAGIQCPADGRPDCRPHAAAQAAFPEGLDYGIVYETTSFISESIHEVFNALRDAVILVGLVVLLFLQSWRATLIPLSAVPVAVVGTFAVMAGLGFSLNNLSLLDSCWLLELSWMMRSWWLRLWSIIWSMD